MAGVKLIISNEIGWEIELLNNGERTMYIAFLPS